VAKATDPLKKILQINPVQQMRDKLEKAKSDQAALGTLKKKEA
jgi:hypothetical protein